MVIFIYGEDNYRSWKKVLELTGEYKKIHPRGLNFLNFDFKTDEFGDFKRALEAVSIFKEKKLILLKNLFSSSSAINDFLGYLKSTKTKIFDDKENIIVIYEAGGFFQEVKGKKINALKEEKKELFNSLLKYSKAQEFEILSGSKIICWAQKEFLKRGVKIDPSALQKLIYWVGADLWRLENEIKKLALFGKKEIGEKEVDLLVRPKMENDIFKMIDAISSRHKKIALKLVREYQNQGESDEYLLSMILWQVRNIAQVKFSKLNSRLQGFSLKNGIAKELKIHPYVAEKSLMLAKKFTVDEIKKVYHKLLEVDYKIKTGKIESTTALILFISEIC